MHFMQYNNMLIYIYITADANNDKRKICMRHEKGDCERMLFSR